MTSKEEIPMVTQTESKEADKNIYLQNSRTPTTSKMPELSKNHYIIGGIVGVILIALGSGLGIYFSTKDPPPPAQLWKLNENKKLQNGLASTWEFGDKIWEIPSEGSEGYIKDISSGMVLTIEGSMIKLENEGVSLDKQMWIKGASNSEDWFTLSNPSSGKFLTSIKTVIKKNNTIIEDEDFGNAPAQLWRLTSDGTLENGFSITWNFEEKVWNLPLDEQEGYIKEKSTGLVLTIVGSTIDLKPNTSSDNQLWIKSKPRSDGLFLLKNPSSNKVLANDITKKAEYTYTIQLQ